jgi:hypothetical protein
MVQFFFGKIRDLAWDPARTMWRNQKSLLDYSTQLGQTLLCDRYLPLDLVISRWKLILPPQFTFAWQEVWDS